MSTQAYICVGATKAALTRPDYATRPCPSPRG